MYSFTTVLYMGSSPNERRMKTAPHFDKTGPRIGMLRFSPAMMCGSERPSLKKSQEMAADRNNVSGVARSPRRRSVAATVPYWTCRESPAHSGNPEAGRRVSGVIYPESETSGRTMCDL